MIKYQVHVIHIVRPRGQHKGDRNVFDVWCDNRNQAEAWLRRHLKDMRGRTTRVHGDIRQVEVADEEPEEVEDGESVEPEAP